VGRAGPLTAPRPPEPDEVAARRAVERLRTVEARAALVGAVGQLVGFGDDLPAAAAWLVRQARRAGLSQACLRRAGGRAPSVFGLRRGTGPRTVLLYAHYDVAPAATYRVTMAGDRLRGRGVSDDRGRLVALLWALRAWSSVGGPPCSVVLLLDGEEERGSPGFDDVLDALDSWLAAEAARTGGERLVPDVALLADSTGGPGGRPVVLLGTRGLVHAELVAHGPRRPVHSGRFGGVAPGPVESLARVVAGLHDGDGRVALPGFYDAVREVGEPARATLRAALPTDAALRQVLGQRVDRWGEPGWSAAERATIRPALTVDAIAGGGGARVPAVARADVRARLVPDQRPPQVVAALRERVRALAHPGAPVDVVVRSASPAVVVPAAHPDVQDVARAMWRACGTSPVLGRSGGTVPAAARLRARGVVPLLLGLGESDDGAHGPVETVRVTTLLQTAAAVTWALEELSR
jgi:acetylornithine deacetylase/succinyl-diaminopimelate desuccinylase-like protein